MAGGSRPRQTFGTGVPNPILAARCTQLSLFAVPCPITACHPDFTEFQSSFNSLGSVSPGTVTTLSAHEKECHAAETPCLELSELSAHQLCRLDRARIGHRSPRSTTRSPG